jgi:uncharacterized OB-fold protein
MRPIKIVMEQLMQSQELGYMADELEGTSFLGYTAEGRVRAQMCRSCGRIVLHGVPDEKT